MNITVAEQEPCKLNIHCEANALEIMDKRAEVLTAFKKAPVKGYREGRAPLDAIRIHYHKQIEDALQRALAEDAFHNTLFEKKLRPHGAPRFTSLLLDGGKFVCDFEMHTKPEVELSDWKTVEIPKPHETTNTTLMTEQLLQELRVKLGTSEPYGDADFVQNGDTVIVDYEGTLEGKKVDALCVTGEMMTVGASPLLGFDNNMLGMTVGETREFDFIAPEGGLPSISGKTVHFKLTLSTGAKNVPCPLDDELAKRMDKKNYSELCEMVSQAAFARVSSIDKMHLHDAIARKLIADTKVDVPNWMTLSEAQFLANQSQLDWNTMIDPDKEKFMQMAEPNVKLSLILDKVRETEPESQLTDQEIFEIIKQNMMQSKMTKDPEKTIQEMAKTGQLQALVGKLRDEHAMSYVAKNIKVVE